ncbi:MAG TPA: cytochrome c [Rhizomicrobium sp.]|jgi:mono/diheme cytochrome c family protein
MRHLALAAALLFATPALAANTDAGKYQAVLGDCAGCHGKDLAGGVTLMTPFGKLVTPNITFDKDTGIGNWSGEDFRQAMKQGVSPGGKLLYPAMPYVNYARMSDGDIAALWTWLRGVKPVHNTVNTNQLRFPFNLRFMMRGWNILFFRPTPLPAQPWKGAAWNRGAYLVTGAAHCATCHTPKNWFGADKSLVLSGASLQGWFAPDLTSDAKAGLGSWSADDIVQYLATGKNAHSIASGPMAEAVENSTSKMADADLKAIATYLKDLPPSAGNGGGASGIEAQKKSGVTLYDVNCAACHGRDGRGSVIFPPLAGSAVVNQSSAETLVRVVLAGTKGAATARAPTGQAMPSFAWKLNDVQVADILTYVRNNWGNGAPTVSADTVGKIRTGLHSGS